MNDLYDYNNEKKNTEADDPQKGHMTEPGRGLMDTDASGGKTKVNRGIILLIVACLVIGAFGIVKEKIESRNEPKRIAGNSPVLTQDRKVPKDRKEFFRVGGYTDTETDTGDTSDIPTDDGTGDTSDIPTDENTGDTTDIPTDAVSEDITEEGSTVNPFEYILEQSGKDDAAGNGSTGDADSPSSGSGRKYGKHDVFDNMNDAGEYISYLVDRGVTGMVDVYITGSIKDDFSSIKMNNYYHNIYAALSGTYYWSEVEKDTFRIDITITRSDCGYVYRNIVYGEEIPEGRDKALRLREEIEKIYNECVTPGMSEFETELKLHDRLISQCKYIGTDSPYDVQHSAYGAIVNKEAVCDGYSKGFSLLLTRAGIDNQVVYGDAGGSHAWNQVKIDGVWYMVDATWDDPEYSSKHETAFHHYFNVSDDYLSVNHKWANESYNACPSMKDNYFNHFGYVYSGQKDYEKAVKERITESGPGVYESVICDTYSVDNAFVKDVSGGKQSEYYNDILNDYYFTNVIIK